MKKKLLCCALLGAMSMAQSVMAQDYDDRWYIAEGGGIAFADKDRAVSDEVYGAVGFGKFVTPRLSVDLEFMQSNADLTANPERNWELLSLAAVGRYHFIQDARSWNPYVAFGLGMQRHNDGTQTQDPALGFNPSRNGNNMLAILGAGIQKDLGRVSLRGEIGMRVDMDDYTDDGTANTSEDHFTDGYAGISFVIPFGAETVAVAAATPAQQPGCEALDDDGDGVNNCNDKCPASEAGQAIGPDGCPVPLTIDLKGVNFDFDKATLRPDAVAILDEAISILQKYPQLRVEVAGHTDSVGTEVYNQGLSQRRASTVYDYLTSHSIDASRLVGPTGFGESKPIDTNSTREGRARNRRTELNVQN